MITESPIITLTTDFGYQDYYVSALKANILNINRNVRLIDVSHSVPAQDIMAGAWVVKNSSFLYPQGTIHVCVIDPGVGTDRKPLLVEAGGHYFIGPDNGLFSLIAEDRPWKAWEISNPDLMASEVSGTFHGRDIFAPAAAHLSKGVKPEEFGSAVADIKTYRWAAPISDSQGIQGWVVHIDRYGNLITNIPKTLISNGTYSSLNIYAGTTKLKEIHHTYQNVQTGDPLALFGSSGMLEISVNQGSAEELLNVHKGAPVSVVFQK